MLDTIAMATQLKGKYKEAFEYADIYASTANISRETNDEKMMELFDLLLEASSESKPVEKIVGTDMRIFCKNFFEEEQDKKSLTELCNAIFRIMCMLLVYSLIDLLLLENQSDLIPLMIGLAIGALLHSVAKYCVQPIILKKKWKPIIYYFLICGIFGVSILGSILLTYNYNIDISTKILFIVAAIYVAIYLVYCAIKRTQSHGIEKLKKEFNQEVQDKAQMIAIAEGMAIRYKRIHKKQQKKGSTYTAQDFSNQIRKEERALKKMNICMVIILTAIVMIEALVSESLIFLLIMGVFEIIICSCVVKSNKKMIKMQIQVINECELQEMDIVEYVAKIKKGC